MRRLLCGFLCAGSLMVFGCADDDFGVERPASDASASVDFSSGTVDLAVIQDATQDDASDDDASLDDASSTDATSLVDATQLDL